MAKSLSNMIKSLRHKGQITDEQCEELLNKLKGHDQHLLSNAVNVNSMKRQMENAVVRFGRYLENKQSRHGTVIAIVGKERIDQMKVTLRQYPSLTDLCWMRECALGTMYEWQQNDLQPKVGWIHRLADAEHSPIRELTFRYIIEDLPYWVSNELCRHHIGIEKYVTSQRNDRQKAYDRTKAPQDAPVTVRLSINAQALINLAHKRLCGKATPEMQLLVTQMCQQAIAFCPWLDGLLVPMCQYRNGCHEMQPCGRWNQNDQA